MSHDNAGRRRCCPFARVAYERGVRPRKIPSYALTDYLPEPLAELGVYVGRFEESVARRPNRIRVHRHTYFELFLLEGQGAHFNDFQEYRLTRRAAVLVRPGQVHGWSDPAGLRGSLLSFTREFLDGPGRHSAMPRPLVDGGGTVVVDVPDAVWASSLRSVHEMEEECRTRPAGWLDVLRAELQIILLRLARIAPARADSSREAGPSAELVRRFQQLVEEHFRTVDGVSDYARRLAVTPGHLGEAVVAHTGRSPGSLIRDRQSLEARRLLLHSSLSVSEIGYHLGFSDPSYFARFFRRETGVSPAEFRQGIREKYQSSGE